ncbi:MAG: VWA domain-containing protein [Chloroflexi bacterium]|nr:VWA domain-containing protein [Chloroflexota bacterium]
MGLLAPLSLALAALAGPIILLYMLRLRRREVEVSSTLLWQRLMQDREANAPWQKLRRNLLLILQLLLLAFLVISLARPFFRVPSVAAGSVALLIDASASMQSADMPGDSTRFQAAQEEARTLISQLASDEVMTIIAAGASPQVLSPPTWIARFCAKRSIALNPPPPAPIGRRPWHWLVPASPDAQKPPSSSFQTAACPQTFLTCLPMCNTSLLGVRLRIWLSPPWPQPLKMASRNSTPP